MKNQSNHARHYFGLILALVGLIGAVVLVLVSSRRASAQAGASWSYTGSTNTARLSYTTTLLRNGKVLVTGGYNLVGRQNVFFNSAEIYDPATGTWSFTGNLNTSRFGHTATLLPNGNVLVVGGISDSQGNVATSAELYNPATGTWSITGNPNSSHYAHTATLLLNGKVLVAGGSANSLNSEIYDPASGIWSNSGSVNVDRFQHTATLLPNGKVLVVAGINCDSDDDCVTLNSAELYDPASGIWSFTGSLNTARFGHTATLLPNGKLLIAGGSNDNNNAQNSAELYDPATGMWNLTGNVNTPRVSHTATLLPNGKVLVAAGRSDDMLKSSELYDPTTGAWSLTANSNSFHQAHTATLLLNGKVLIAGGGGDADGAGNTAELYDPGTNPNQIDDAQFFVRQHYLDSLNREPDPVGLAYWTDRITQCGSDTRCVHERRIGVSAAFFIELEFQDTGYYVYRIYKASFGRQPNYAEFSSDRGKVIGSSNLEASKQAFADEWMQRAAFLAAYPNTMSNTEVVNKLFDSAGLTASRFDAQRQQEIAAMNSGRSRALVLRDVIEIADFKNIPDPGNPRYSEIKQTSQYNPAFVLMQYFGYLRRDVDRDGYDFWLDVVNNREPNNYHGMVCAFITSREYQLRFGLVVTRSNADCGQ